MAGAKFRRIDGDVFQRAATVEDEPDLFESKSFSSASKRIKNTSCHFHKILKDFTGSAMKYLLATSWLLCLALCAVMRLPAAEYEVDGQVEQTTYKPYYSVATFHKFQFTVYVRDCAWLIRMAEIKSNEIPAGGTEIACVNGTEICKISGPRESGSDVLGKIGSLNWASVVSNTVPTGPGIIGHIWQMFASGCYFKNRTDNRLTPVFDPNASADIQPYLRLMAKWELIDGPVSLPKSVIYYRDNNNNVYPANRPIEASYTATGVTNAGSIKIPSGFVFEWKNGVIGQVTLINTTNAPVIDQHAATEHLKMRAVCAVTAVRPYCSRKDFTPTAKGRTVVTDLRALQEVWSPTLPTNADAWLFQVGLWDGRTTIGIVPRPTNITAELFAQFSGTSAPKINDNYIVEDGVVWLPLAAAKQFYVEGNSFQAASNPSMVVTGITNGEVSFAYFDKTRGNRQTANINVLGMNVAITQGAKPILAGVGLLANGSFQFGFSNNPGVPFTVWMATNLSLPLKDWTPLGAPTYIGSGQYQFTDSTATKDAQRFYRVTSP